MPTSGDTGAVHTGPFGGTFDKDGKPTTGASGTKPQDGTASTGQQNVPAPVDSGAVHTGPFGGTFDKDGKPVKSGSKPSDSGSGDTGAAHWNSGSKTSGQVPVDGSSSGTGEIHPGLAHPDAGKWVMVPTNFDQRCIQNVFEALKCGSCSQC